MSTAAASEAVNRVSPVAYYLQLTEWLQNQIASGRLPVGERLPSEGDLATTHKVSRATVREALRLLEEQGWVVRVARRGAFASMPEQRGWLLQGREGFFEDAVEGRQRRVTTHVLRAEQAMLPEPAAEALHLPTGSQGYILERVRDLDGHLALFSVNYLPAEIGNAVARSDVPSGAGSLNSTLRKAGYAVAGAFRTVEAVPAQGEIADRLKVKAGTPLLKIRSTSWNSDLMGFDHHETWVRSDVVRVEIMVGTPPAAQGASVSPEIARIPSP